MSRILKCDLCGILLKNEKDIETWYTVSICSKGSNNQLTYYRDVCPDCFERLKKRAKINVD